MVRTDFSDVRAFHVKFSLPTDDGSPPMFMESTTLNFRLEFLEEERSEYIVAYHRRKLTPAVDALIDFIYVVFGTALFMRAASPVLSASPVHEDPWPIFERVKNYSFTRGYPLARSPQLLDFQTYDVLEKSVFYHLKNFKLAHMHGQMNFALSALYHAASDTYLTAAMMGVPWPQCWTHVQAANMAKARVQSASDSKRGSAWDVIKPTGWVSPDYAIHSELVRAGAQLT